MTSFMNVLIMNNLIFLLLCQTNSIRLVFTIQIFPVSLSSIKLTFYYIKMNKKYSTNYSIVIWEKIFFMMLYLLQSAIFFVKMKEIASPNVIHMQHMCLYLNVWSQDSDLTFHFINYSKILFWYVPLLVSYVIFKSTWIVWSNLIFLSIEQTQALLSEIFWAQASTNIKFSSIERSEHSIFRASIERLDVQSFTWQNFILYTANEVNFIENIAKNNHS